MFCWGIYRCCACSRQVWGEVVVQFEQLQNAFPSGAAHQAITFNQPRPRYKSGVTHPVRPRQSSSLLLRDHARERLRLLA